MLLVGMMNPKQHWRHSLDLRHLTWPTNGWGYLPPIKDVFEMFEYIEGFCQPRSILEIGYHAGHSTTYMLETFPNSHVTTYGVSKPAHATYGSMMDHYTGRLNIILEKSETLALDFSTYDFAFVDGNHTYEGARHDILLCVERHIPYMLIDNVESKGVAKAREDVYRDTSYKKIHLVEYFSSWNNVIQWNTMELWANV